MPESIYHLEPGRYLLSQIYHNRGDTISGSIVPAVGSSIYDDTMGGPSFKEYVVTGHDSSDYAILEEVGGDLYSQDRLVSLADQQLLIYLDESEVEDPTHQMDMYHKVWIDWKLRVQNPNNITYKYQLATEINGEGEPESIISRSVPELAQQTNVISFTPNTNSTSPIPACYIPTTKRNKFEEGPVWMFLYSNNDVEIGRIKLQPTISQLPVSNDKMLVNIIPEYEGVSITGTKTLDSSELAQALDPSDSHGFGCTLEYRDGNDVQVPDVLNPPNFSDGGCLKMYGPDVPNPEIEASYPVVIKYFLPPHSWGIHSGGSDSGSTRFITTTFNIEVENST